jgi:hypothetical protein
MQRILFAALLLSLLLGGHAQAQQSIVLLTIPEISMTVDETELLDVTITCTEGDCVGFDVTLEFDPAIIQVNSASLGEFLGETARVPRRGLQIGEGQVRFAALSATPSGEVFGTLFQLEVTALGPGETPITFIEGVVVLQDTNETQPAVVVGRVTVNGTAKPSATITTETPTPSLTPSPTETPTDTPTFTPAPPTNTPAPCLVRATRSDVPIHVGPGQDRNVRATLPPNRDYEVRGQAQDSGGGQWLNIVWPSTTEPDRWWVAAANVEMSGDCSSAEVVPTSAFVQARPAAPTATPTGGRGGAPTTGTPATTAPIVTGTVIDCTQIFAYQPGGSVSSGMITFGWSPVAGADFYRIIVSQNRSTILWISDASQPGAVVDGSGWSGPIEWVAQAVRRTPDGEQSCESATFRTTVVRSTPTPTPS